MSVPWGRARWAAAPGGPCPAIPLWPNRLFCVPGIIPPVLFFIPSPPLPFPPPEVGGGEKRVFLEPQMII